VLRVLYNLLCGLKKLNKLRIVSLKTQVRRLRYFSVFIRTIAEAGSKKGYIQDEIIKWSLSSHDYFITLASPTGEIIRPRTKIYSQSFLNYYNAFKVFNIFTEENELVILTRMGKMGKALLIEQKNFDYTYRLTETEKLLTYFMIIQSDADYIISLLEALNSEPNKSQEYFIKNFKEIILNRLNKKISYSSTSSRYRIFDAINRIKNWRNAERYCEDIVPPRFNWFIDLDLVDVESFRKCSTYKLSNKGLNLLTRFQNYDQKYRDISDQWLEESFCNSSILLLDKNEFKFFAIYNDNEKTQILENVIEKSITNFRILNLPRLSLNQAIYFLIFSLLVQHSIVCEYKEIVNWIGFQRKIGKRKIGIRKTAREYESYLYFTD